jgi:ArsR family transcriptional regulator, arsenate/arsenite/antimonite-responsive transcriptional repressor
MSMDRRDAAVIRVARALGDPTRLLLLRAISAADEISCQELTALVPLSQATVSHHLKVLSDAGLVSVRKSGAFHYYRAVPGALRAHAEALGGVLRSAAPRRPAAAARAHPARRSS